MHHKIEVEQVIKIKRRVFVSVPAFVADAETQGTADQRALGFVVAAEAAGQPVSWQYETDRIIDGGEITVVDIPF